MANKSLRPGDWVWWPVSSPGQWTLCYVGYVDKRQVGIVHEGNAVLDLMSSTWVQKATPREVEAFFARLDELAKQAKS